MPRAAILPSLANPGHNKGLGARLPEHKPYVEKYPLLAAAPPAKVERTMPLPAWHWSHDQGNEGACVGFGGTMMMAVRNLAQNQSDPGVKIKTVRYDPWWLWDQAKIIDPWAETNPGDENGTSVDASCQVMKAQGLVRYRKTTKLLARLGFLGSPSPQEGIEAYRWATTVDEMRACIAGGQPISIGVNWYNIFDTPEQRNGEWYIAPDGITGDTRGGHCVCVYGASDRRQAFRVKNSWGHSYPLAWLPYSVMEQLLREDGEACIVTDR